MNSSPEGTSRSPSGASPSPRDGIDNSLRERIDGSNHPASEIIPHAGKRTAKTRPTPWSVVMKREFSGLRRESVKA